MKKLRIKLSTPKDVEEFVNIASKYDYDIDLRSGVVYIDAKSFLGVMTMGLERELDVECAFDDADFNRRVSKFAVA